MKQLALLFSIFAVVACGRQQPQSIPTTSIRSVHVNQQIDFFLASGSETYQIGAEFGKKQVTAATLATETPGFVRTARATGRTSNGGTAFYLGKFNGEHIMATNHHVFENDNDCAISRITLPFLAENAQGHFDCTHLIGSWDSVDFALFVITVSNPEDEARLAAIARNVDFNVELKRGEPLLTIGFGIANNPGRNMMANQDSDCKVFSADGDYRLLADPDELNPGPYKAWSFINGCDVSHGDSGSAMVDRLTGQIVGIIWTGKIPKKPEVREPGYTDRILASDSPEIWTELSMAVPAPKIGEHLRTIANDRNTAQRDKDILHSIAP